MKSKTPILLSIATAAAGIVLVLYSYIGTFTRLLADDYCSFYDAKRLDVLHYIWYWYITWGGRYSAIATDNLLQYIGPVGVRFVPPTVLVFWLLALVFLFQQILKKEISKHTSWLAPITLSSLMLFSIIIISPQSQQVFYWWNGMRTYIPALVITTVHIALLYWAADRLHTQRDVWIATLVSFGLALFSGGYNETFTAIQFMFFSGITVFLLLVKSIRLTDRIFPLLPAAILGSLSALVIMFLSPGASNRQEFFPPPPGILTMLQITTDGYLAYLSDMFGSLPKLSTMVAVILVALWIGSEAEQRLETGWSALLCIAGGFGLAFASLLPSAYGLSEMPAPRTFIIPTYLLLCGLAFGGLALGRWLLHSSKAPSFSGKSVLLVITLAIVCGSAVLNASVLYKDMKQYTDFAKLWDSTDALIIQAHENHERSVTIPAMDNWAGLERPIPDKKYWPNVCFSLYYDIQVYGPSYD